MTLAQKAKRIFPTREEREYHYRAEQSIGRNWVKNYGLDRIADHISDVLRCEDPEDMTDDQLILGYILWARVNDTLNELIWQDSGIQLRIRRREAAWRAMAALREVIEEFGRP